MTITVSGDASIDPMLVGNTGVGTLSINGGPAETRTSLGIGLMATGDGRLSLGAGSSLVVSRSGPLGSLVQVGVQGKGVMELTNGAAFEQTGETVDFQIGGQLGPPGTATGALHITAGGHASIHADGSIFSSASLRIGANLGSRGELVVDGPGSNLSIQMGASPGMAIGVLFVGQFGEGKLLVENGGSVSVVGMSGFRPRIEIGGSVHGETTITGSNSVLNFSRTGETAGSGNLINVGDVPGGMGVLKILDGGKCINDLNSNHSVTAVGSNAPDATGEVIVDGAGNAETLFDAGQLLAVGGGWNGSGATLLDYSFFGTMGTGSVSSLNAAVVRANIIAVGDKGTISGNSVFDGSVHVGGVINSGRIAPGPSLGVLTITGDLNVQRGLFEMEASGLALGTHYDQVKANGAVMLEDANFTITAGAGFNFADGNRLVLIDGGTLATTDIGLVDVTIAGEPGGLAFQVADEGTDFVFEALNNGSGAALVSFGAASTNAATAMIGGTTGTGSGGRFEAVKFFKATGLEGTAAGDNFSVVSGSGAVLRGLAGNDILSANGAGGADRLEGGLGNDTYNAIGAGDIVVEAADEGIDTINTALDSYTLLANAENLNFTGVGGFTGQGNALANRIVGGSGNDRFRADAGGADRFIGGLGNDSMLFSATAGVSIDLATGIHSGAALGDFYSGVETFYGSAAGGDFMTGGAYRISFLGQGGNDTLSGGGVADYLSGGLGADVLAGGSGRDIFDFNDILESTVGAAGQDTITDFNADRTDRIDIVSIDADSSDADNDVFTFIGGNAFSGVGQVRWFQTGTDTIVEVNTMGSAAADMTIVLNGLLTLDVFDFRL